MANIRPLTTITRIARDVHRLTGHVINHSGIPDGQARAFEDEVTAIACEMASLIEIAQVAQHKRVRPGALLKRMRKLLGFTYP